jgi:hypothetical protein
VASYKDQEDGEIAEEIDSNAATESEPDTRRDSSVRFLRAPDDSPSGSDESSSDSESSGSSGTWHPPKSKPRKKSAKQKEAKRVAKRAKKARQNTESYSSSSSSQSQPQALVATRQIPSVEPLASLSRGHIDKFKLAIEALRRAQDMTAISVFIPEPLQRLLTLQFSASFHIKKGTRIE